MAELTEVGARNSAADIKSIQAIHDHSAMLGADCKTQEALHEAAAVMRQSDSFNARQGVLYSAVRGKFAVDPSFAWNGSDYGSGPAPWIRDVFEDTVIVSIGDDLYAIPYTLADVRGDMVATLGTPVVVECAYVPTGTTDVEPDENIEALRTLIHGQKGVLLAERDIPDKAREKMADSDFAGKDKSFPIAKPEDVVAAAKSIGRAGADNFSTDELKANIIKIAKRKGASFVAQLPDAWKENPAKESFTAGDTALIKKGTGKGKEVTIIGKSKVADGHFTHKDAKGNLGSTHVDDLAVVDNPAQESEVQITGDLIPLVERIISAHSDQQNMVLISESAAAGNIFPIKLIGPGWGSSGYYSEEILKRDGPIAFPVGTHMFWNHQTAEQEASRPEGDLDDLAGVLVSLPEWKESGPKGKGLYADGKVFSDHVETVREKGPYIGVSIRAMGKASLGEAEGRRGQIIERLVTGKSTDFVTRAGAGGAVFTESQRSHIRELQESLRADPSGEAIKPAAQSRIPTKEQGMTEQEIQSLREAAAKTDRLETELARMKERNLVADATAHATRSISDSGLPDVTKKRLIESLAKNPPATDKGDLDVAKFTALVETTVKEESAYLAEATNSGKVRNLGPAGTKPATEAFSDADVDKLLESSFGRLGMTESAAKVAAQGRM